MKIAVIGTGYVGLVTGACLADTGNQVICADSDSAKIEKLRSAKIPFFEPGLEELIRHAVDREQLKFTASPEESVRESEVIILAVGTPSLPDGSVDLSQVQIASESIARAMDGYRLIAVKSTVPVGTNEKITHWISKLTRHPFDVVSNPEFLKEGSALDDFLKPDRIVIGTLSEAAHQKMLQLYAPFVRQGNPIVWMDPLSAEVTKYACNAFLATRISFINEMAMLCEKTGADIEKVRRGMCTDTRIGKHFLYPGVGFGGSCFPKDVRAILKVAEAHGVPLDVVSGAQSANERQKHVLAEKIGSYFKEKRNGGLSGRTIAIWGLAFKPNTDDVREAPALTLISDLLALGCRVRAFDPEATENARSVLGSSVEFCKSPYEACKGADALAVVTEWNEFKHPDFEKLGQALTAKLIFDGRNLYYPRQMRELGFEYFSIGRTPVK